jgi:hypothetical protein
MLNLPVYEVATGFNPLNAEFNPTCHLLALLGGASIVVFSRLKGSRPKVLKIFVFFSYKF